MARWWRWATVVVPVALALTVAAMAAGSAEAYAPAPVPCHAIGHGKYDCQFWPAGDGISAGAPVMSSAGHRVGYLNHGTNYVFCEVKGEKLSSGSTYNVWWAYTLANDDKYGWVNAIYAHGGANDGDFEGVPACGSAHGYPPGGAPAPTPTPKPTPPSNPTPYRYVALGDSYSSGEGLAPFTGPSDTDDDHCHRSKRSYPYLLHRELTRGPFSDWACSGATTDKVSTFPQYGPERVAQALHPSLTKADLVTISLGGDDLGFSSSLHYCFTHTYCQHDDSFASGVNGKFAALPGDLDAAYNQIRRHIKKGATVIVLGYPRLFPTIRSHQQCQILHGHFGYGYEDSEQDYFNAKAVRLDRIIAAAAKRAGFLFVSPANNFLGHAQCDPDPWLNGLSLRQSGHFTTLSSFHPNTKGQRQFATLLENWIAEYPGPRNANGLPRDPKATMPLPVPPPECRPGKPC